MTASPYVRHDSQILVGVEDTQGTSVGPSRTFGKIDGDTEMPDPSVEWQEERSISGSGSSSRMPTGKYPGQNVYDGGSIPIIPVDGFPIALLLGADSYDSDTNTHTITVNDGKLPPTCTIEATYFGRNGGNDFVREFTGAATPSGTVSVDNEGRLTTELDFVAMGVDTNSSPTTGISPDDRDPWLFHDVASDLSLAGTTYARVTEFEWELGTNADPKHYLNSSNAEDPFEVLYGNAEPQLSATIVPTDDSLYQELRNRTASGNSASIEFLRGGSGDSLKFEFTNIGFQEAPHSFPEEGNAEVEVSVLYDDVTVTVEDSKTSSAYV